VSARDRDIIASALRKLGGVAGDFGEAVRALREATEELIPAGRTYFLGATAEGPIIGSIISGVGIVASSGSSSGVRIARIGRDGRVMDLGGLAP